LSNTRLGEELPATDEGQVQKWGLEFFPVPAIIDYSSVPAGSSVCAGGAEASSKKYDDLHVTFFFGDDDGLDRSEFLAPEHLKIQPEVGPFMRFMQGIKVNGFTQTYTVHYPVVVNVWDSSMRKSFKFATNVFIDGYAPASCTSPPALSGATQSAYSGTYDDLCVSGATQDASVLVRYDDGSDVVGATVQFYTCDLGTTGRGLPIETKVPPVWGELTVRDGQNEYTECRSASELRNIIVEIPRSKHYIFKFYTVGVSKSGTTYRIDSVSPATDRIEVVMERDGDVCKPPEPEIVINMDNDGAFVSEMDYANLPVTEYDVGVGTTLDGTIAGFVNMTGFTPGGSTLYVYSPKMTGFGEADLDGVQKLFENCATNLGTGIDPVSKAEYTGIVGCSWTG
jgi:hypothetical protein